MIRDRLEPAAILAVVALCSIAARGNASDLTLAYGSLQTWQFASTPVAVADLEWSRDVATWRLESGVVKPMKANLGGAVTGFVFEGRGRFTLEIPDPFEIDQLRRFAGDDSLEGIEVGFSRMVFRTSGPLPPEVSQPAGGTEFRPDDVARTRHQKWLEQARLDVDARILAGLFVSGDDYLIADMDTDEFGWLTIEVEPWRDEEINILKLVQMNSFVEEWVSLRAFDDGPATRGSTIADLVDIDVEVDLLDHKGSKVTRGQPIEADWVHFRTTLTLEALRDGIAALQLSLHPRARDIRISSPGGGEIESLRDRIGDRFAGIPNDVWDGTVTVFLGEVLAAGDRRSITVDYDIEIYNYASGSSWYPTVAGAENDLHTARLAFHLPSKLDVWSVGERIDDPMSRGPSWEVWQVTEPSKMIGFTFGSGFEEVRLEIDGLPEVIVIGDPTGFGGEKKLRNVGADIINSLNFFTQYFGYEPSVDRIYATSITSSHGQAFPGFIHLSRYTFDAEHPGASELFRAHEVAHQIWGHTVMWGSYRDQWLSEAFAEYSAMLYVRASIPNKDYFDDILEVYTAEQLGSFKGAMSKFARPWDVDLVRVGGEELGPIAAGYRASTAKIPSGGTIQLYRKGALFLHMVDAILQAMAPQGQDPFRSVMHEFLIEYSGREATTEDFKSVLERVSGKDWDPLFDSWVYGCGTPTYEWSWNVEHGSDGAVLAIEVDQLDVPDGFSAVVPIRITLPGNRVGTNLLPVNTTHQTFRIPLPDKPAKVELNPDHAVPARVKLRK